MQNTVAVTGSFCSGKSSVCALMGRYGYGFISADAVAREVLDDRKIQKKVIKEFGVDVASGGRVDRKKLAEAVFGSRAAWVRINRLIHPVVIQRVKKRLSSKKSARWVVEVPLLFEAGMQKMFDAVIYVGAPVSIRRQRAKEKGFKASEVARRGQFLIAEGKKKRDSDFVIINNGRFKELQRKVKDVMTFLKQKEKKNAKSEQA
jgi:dephospho-CoA kinase